MSTRAIAVFLFILLSFRFASSASPTAETPKSDVKVIIAVREYLRESKKNPIQVVIENTSDNPQAHFDEWNSWGYYNLTLAWTDRKGNTGVVEKVPNNWDKNAASTTILKPGDALVREISFDSVWKGWPDDLTDVTIQAVYQSKVRKDDLPMFARERVTPWIGTARSKAQAVSIQR